MAHRLAARGLAAASAAGHAGSSLGVPNPWSTSVSLQDGVNYKSVLKTSPVTACKLLVYRYQNGLVLQNMYLCT